MSSGWAPTASTLIPDLPRGNPAGDEVRMGGADYGEIPRIT
jgi:hypothetical protein